MEKFALPENVHPHEISHIYTFFFMKEIIYFYNFIIKKFIL